MIPKHIALFGNFGRRNLGNECTLQAMRLNILSRLPAVDLRCICTDPTDVSSRHGMVVVPMNRAYRAGASSSSVDPASGLRRLVRIAFRRVPSELAGVLDAIRAVRGVDILMFTGTGMLEDNWGGSLKWPFEVLKWTAVARASGCRVRFVSIGAGPIHHPFARIMAKTALRLADYVSYRNPSSEAYVRSIQLETSSHRLYPDLAFSLPMPPLPRPEALSGRALVIGVGVMDYFGHYETGRRAETYAAYLDKMSEFITWLVEQGYGVRLLQGDARYDPPVVQDLLAMVQRSASYRVSTAIQVPSISSVDEVIAELSTTDIVIAPRFHNLVLALVLGKPVISLSYHKKNDELLGDLGLADCCHPLDEFDVARLRVQVANVIENARSYSARIARGVQVYRTSLDQQYATVLDV